MSEGGAAAVDSDEPVVGNSEVKKLEDRVRELERMLGRKTMEVEILREALSKADSKKRISRPILLPKDGGRHARRLPFQPRRTVERQIKPSRVLSQGRRCRASACHPQAGGSKANLWLSADRRASQSREACRDEIRQAHDKLRSHLLHCCSRHMVDLIESRP